MRVTPCKECSSRYENCHAVCSSYKDWRAEWDTEKERVTTLRLNELRSLRTRNEGIARMKFRQSHR